MKANSQVQSVDVKEVTYANYLQVEDLLSLQKPLVKDAHEEMLFIIVHQCYELWFKQILHELDSIQNFFSGNVVQDNELGIIHNRLSRINQISKLCINQFDLFNTMTPLQFLEFRDQLGQSSGLQGLQFRLLEVKLGLVARKNNKDSYLRFYSRNLKPEEAKRLCQVTEEKSLLEYVHSWLKRLPFLKRLDLDHDFEEHYIKALNEYNSSVELQEQDQWQNWFLSKKAVLATLFIWQYRHWPLLQVPAKILDELLVLDENLTLWRQRHTMLAHKMLGRKIGTGGSSGFEYLQKTALEHRVFEDFFNITTFLVPRVKMKALPEELEQFLKFQQVV